MRQSYKIISIFLILLLCLSPAVFAEEQGSGSESTRQIVLYLIDVVAHSELTFIRNGEEHTCAEAARHMARKYEYFKGKIKSAEDFIHYCASKSLVSGEPYLVSTRQGSVPVEKWLGHILLEHEQNPNHS